ncbi:MAG: cysteine desulfurase NifS [Clostridiales bacterium]|jgi:cysteine desulfurase|nr:cysteine desulfurase NifS [Clostridiales bacterium]
MIYLDNAATTRVRQEVLDKMLPYLTDFYGNPSSIYALGREAKKAIEDARAKVAAALSADKNEIYFTGSGTEADNWAIKSAALSYAGKGKHIIASQVEHHAVLHTCEALKKEGYEITYLPVDEYGIINPGDLEKAIRPDTILISVMFANNEIGSIQPVKEIGRIAREHKVLFHTDAVQAAGHVPINVNEMNIDMLSLSGHKMYAPKGIGALYAKQGIKLAPFIHGGAQERKKRAGTENVANIAALGEAISLIVSEMDGEAAKAEKLRDKLINGILTEIPHARLNGSAKSRLPGNVNISFEFIEGESLLLLLDMKGIAASSGSACTSGSLDPSHVLMATGLKHEMAHGSLRLTIGKYNTEEEIDKVLEELPPIVKRLRDMSPLYEQYIKDNIKDKKEGK